MFRAPVFFTRASAAKVKVANTFSWYQKPLLVQLFSIFMEEKVVINFLFDEAAANNWRR
jgi:hypothetical protein